MEEYLENIIAEDLEEAVDLLAKYLQSCGIDLTSKTLFADIKRLNDVIAIKKSKQNLDMNVNDTGYITNILDIKEIVEKQQVPVDVLRGYYKYENGKIVLDERRRQELWG